MAVSAHTNDRKSVCGLHNSHQREYSSSRKNSPFSTTGLCRSFARRKSEKFFKPTKFY